MQRNDCVIYNTGKNLRKLELYVHIPFCIRKCAYCDFLSWPAEQGIQEQYRDALISEIRSFDEGQKEEATVVSVFFGGGTPSVWSAKWIGSILETLREAFVFSPDAEITIECNPGTADAKKLCAYRQMGINRVSFGLQSADNAELRVLGRIHTWERFLETYQDARRAGFDNINIDLMSALPGQSLSSWEETLRRVLALHPEHISAYSLIIEEGTPFYERYAADDERRAEGEKPQYLPSEEEERQMYARTEELLAQAGMHRYEISNYALPGRECLHNIGYWIGTEYLGFGLGASSLWNHVRYRNTEDMETYLRVFAGRRGQDTAGIRQAEVLTEMDEMEEFMFLGLRMMCGISEKMFADRFGSSVEEVYGSAVKRLIAQGLLARENGRIFLTHEGINVSNPVMAEFLLTDA